MATQDLIKIVAPPAKPFGNDRASPQCRQAIEKSVGLDLPDDLFEFAAVYGCGQFKYGGSAIYVNNPFSMRDYLHRVSMSLEAARVGKGFPEVDDDEFPYEVHPKRPGLFPWGRNDDGSDFFWLTSGDDPNDWPTVIYQSDPICFEEWNLPMTSYLSGVFNKTIKCLAYGNRPSDNIEFRSGDW